MEQVIQVTGLCVVGALLALVVKRGSPETALLLAVFLLGVFRAGYIPSGFIYTQF